MNKTKKGLDKRKGEKSQLTQDIINYKGWFSVQQFIGEFPQYKDKIQFVRSSINYLMNKGQIEKKLVNGKFVWDECEMSSERMFYRNII